MLTIPAAFLSAVYAANWFWGDVPVSHEAIYPTVKPFVYRALMPLIGQLLAVSGLQLDVIVIALIALSGAAFIITLDYLAVTFYTLKEWELVAIFGGYLMAFSKYPKIYDLMSAALFTLCLAFLARGMYGAYLVAFVFAAVNRETAVLLIPVTAIYLWSQK